MVEKYKVGDILKFNKQTPYSFLREAVVVIVAKNSGLGMYDVFIVPLQERQFILQEELEAWMSTFRRLEANEK